jgi:nitrate reductase NapAB chaperone NapD
VRSHDIQSKENKYPDIEKMLRELVETSVVKISVNGKFMGTLEAEITEDKEALLKNLKHAFSQNTTGIKNPDLFEKTVLPPGQEFKNVIIVKNKGIVNFLVKK